MRAPDRTEQGRPIERLELGVRFQLVRAFVEYFFRRDELLAHGLRRARPAIVKHRRPRHARPHPSLAGADPKALGVLKGADLLTEPHPAHLPAIPGPVRGQCLARTLEAQGIHEQSFAPGTTAPT